MGEPTDQTASDQADEPARRKGSVEDIVGMRVFYRLAGEDDERWIDWRNDRGPTIAEAMAVKAATVSKVNIGRMLAVLRSTAELYDDPEAMQGLVWMIRRFRQGEDQLPITALSTMDVTSVREDYFDAQHVFLDFVEDDPDPEQAARAADIAAELQRRLPGLDNRQAYLAAVGLVVAFPDPAPDGDAAGEGQAGDAGERPAAAPATTRKTSKRSPASGSRSSRSRTGSAGRTSSATPPGRG